MDNIEALKKDELDRRRVINDLSSILLLSQRLTIGLFKGPEDKEYTPVIHIDEEKNTVQLLQVKSLLGLQTATVDLNTGHYAEFPDGKSLRDMIQEPTLWEDWWYVHIISQESRE